MWWNRALDSEAQVDRLFMYFIISKRYISHLIKTSSMTCQKHCHVDGTQKMLAWNNPTRIFPWTLGNRHRQGLHARHDAVQEAGTSGCSRRSWSWWRRRCNSRASWRKTRNAYSWLKPHHRTVHLCNTFAMIHICHNCFQPSCNRPGHPTSCFCNMSA